jgi:lysophospholipase
MEFFTFEPEPAVHIRYAVSRTSASMRRVLILANGRGEFIEKYEEVIQELNTRGFDVWTMDWRGQGLSSRPLAQWQKGHCDSFEMYLSDFHKFVQRVENCDANGGPYLIGHSMGGHLGLRYLAMHPETFSRAVIIAPLIEFPKTPFSPLIQLVVKLMCALGCSRWYFFRGDYGSKQEVFEGNRLTSDPERFKIKGNAIRKNPKLALGGITLGWLRAAGRSVATLRRVAERILCPVLFVVPEREQVVDGTAAPEFARRVPRGEVCLLADSRHEVLFETDAIREQFWSAVDPFLKDANTDASSD